MTAHEKYAVEAFATSAVDYLVKPVNPERLAETIRRLGEIAAIQRLKSAATGGDASLPDDKEADDATASAAAADRDSTTNVGLGDTISVPLRAKGRAAMVPIADICWIESLRNSTRVCLMNPGRILFFRRRLGEWEADLPAGLFERLGKSLVVQIAMIQETEWKPRDETVLTFAADIEPLVIGRPAAMRLRDVLGEGGDGLACPGYGAQVFNFRHIRHRLKTCATGRHRLTTCATWTSEGLPVHESRRCFARGATMAKRGKHRVSGGHDGNLVRHGRCRTGRPASGLTRGSPVVQVFNLCVFTVHLGLACNPRAAVVQAQRREAWGEPPQDAASSVIGPRPHGRSAFTMFRPSPTP